MEKELGILADISFLIKKGPKNMRPFNYQRLVYGTVFHILLGFFNFFTILSCGPTKPNPSPKGLSDLSPKQRQCQSLFQEKTSPLIADHLLRALKCLTKEKDSSSSLQPFIDLINQMGLSQVDLALDFVLTGDDTTSHPNSYPTLDLISKILTRGIDPNRSNLHLLEEQRFGTLDHLMKNLDLTPLIKLISQWAKQDDIPRILEIFSILLQKIPSSHLESIIATFLTDDSLRQNTINVVEQLIQNNKFNGLLADLLTLSASTTLAQTDLKNCLSLNRNPILASWDDTSCTQILSGSANDFIGHFRDFWYNTLSSDERKNLITSLSNLMRNLAGLNHRERHQIFSSLLSFFQNLGKFQTNSIEYFLNLAHHFIQSNLSDLDHLLKGMEIITNQKSLFGSFEEKIGTTVLRDIISRQIDQGFTITGCGNLYFKPRPQDNIDEIRDYLRHLLTPMKECGKIPPLFALIRQTISESCEECIQENNHSRPSRFSEKFESDFAYPSSENLNEIFHLLIKTTVSQLIDDPYYLMHKGLAYDSISPAFFRQLIEHLDILSGSISIEKITNGDLYIHTNKPYAQILTPNFLKRLLDDFLVQAANWSYYRSHFFSSHQNDQQKFLRMARGLYPGSFIEYGMKNNLTKAIDEIWPHSRSRDSLNLSWMKSVLFNTNIVFKNLITDKKQDQDVLDKNYSSSTSHIFRIQADGNIDQPKNTDRSYAKIFLNGEKQAGDRDDHLALWSRWIDAGPINGINSELGQESEMIETLKLRLLPILNKKQVLTPSPDFKPNYDSILDKTPYSLGEKRVMALFFLRNYVGIAAPRPSEYKISYDRYKKHKTVPGFYNERFFTTTKNSWAAFRSLISTEDFSPSEFHNLGKNLLPQNVETFHKDLEVMYHRPMERGATEISTFSHLSQTEKTLLFSHLTLPVPINGKSRRPERTLLPLLSYHDQNCPMGQPKPHSCFLEFPSNEKSRSENYDQFKNIVASLTQLTLCQLTDSEVFSSEFRHVMTQELSIDAEHCYQLSQNPHLTVVSIKSDYPRPIIESILIDLITKTAKHYELKPGIAHSPVLIELASAKKNPMQFQPLPVVSIFSHDSAAHHHKRQLDQGTFRWIPPSFINSAINTYAISTDPQSTREQFRTLGRKFLPDGGFLEIIDLIMESREDLREQKNGSVLTFFLHFFQKVMERPDIRKSLENIIVFPSDLEFGDILGYELPLGLKDLYSEQTGNPLNWENSGVKILKSILRREFFLPILQAMDSLSPQSINSLTNIIHISLGNLGAVPQQEQVIRKLVDFLTYYLFSVDSQTNQHHSRFYQSFLLSTTELTLNESWKQSIHRLIDWLEKPLIDFSVHQTPSVSSHLEQYLSFAIDDGWDLARIYQQTHDIGRHSHFTSQLFFSLLAPLRPPESRYFKDILGDLFPSSHRHFFYDQLDSPKTRRQMNKMIKSLTNTSRDSWLAALDFTTNLDAKTIKLLNSLHQNIIWSSPTHPSSTQRFMVHLHYLLTHPKMLQSQATLVKPLILGYPPTGGNHDSISHPTNDPFFVPISKSLSP